MPVYAPGVLNVTYSQQLLDDVKNSKSLSVAIGEIKSRNYRSSISSLISFAAAFSHLNTREIPAKRAYVL